ncbi:MAG: ABC transporter permease [Actinomycetota bacterium]|nr:ABC transporter permease [Actinomycetota bacterium]
MGVAAVISRRRTLGLEAELAVATIRALVQLGAVALVIQAIFDHLGLSGIFVLIMLTAAAWTSARRIPGVPQAPWRAAAAIGGASAVTLLPLFATGAFQLAPRFLIPLSGIVIGGAMKASSLAGLRLSEEVGDGLPEIEARLALGVSARQALQPSLRRSVITALVPAIDQTKNVGLVTLPGAFVGMLLGGASPLEAAQVQLTVLLALLGAEALAATGTGVLVARAVIRAGERIQPPVEAR